MIALEEVFSVRGYDTVNEREVQEAVDRAVRNEARILTIETTVKAVAEISSEVRKEVRNVVDELRRHAASDDTRFGSIDSRFVGEQNQLTQILNSLTGIEKKMTEENADIERLVSEVFEPNGESKLRPVVEAHRDERSFWRALRVQWTVAVAGAGFATTVIGGIVALSKVL